MIKNWNEIQKRFDAIKDHKPRANSKLNELGEVLSSAYSINPTKANEMWQYIIDLNTEDDLSYSKFYIGQVFNKLYEKMKPGDAAQFICLNPNRVKMMLEHGYKERMPWYLLEHLVSGNVAAGDAENAVICAEYYYNQFGGVGNGNPDILDVTGRVLREMKSFIEEDNELDTVKGVLNRLENLGDPAIYKYTEVFKAAYGIESELDYESLFAYAIEYGFSDEFFNMLWTARDEFSDEELVNKWIEYIDNTGDDYRIPNAYSIHEDVEECSYENSKLKYYVDLLKESDDLLEVYFNKSWMHEMEKGVVWIWIEEGDWDQFVKYVSKSIMSIEDDRFGYSEIQRLLNDFMEATSWPDYSTMCDDYDRDYKELMKPRVEEFCRALSKISAITVGCDAHEAFHEMVKNYLSREIGNLDDLKEVGFQDEQVNSAEQRLKDYVHRFFESGELIHVDRSQYDMIRDALKDEIDAMDEDGDESGVITVDITGYLAKALGVELDDEEDEDDIFNEDQADTGVDHELECYYRLASDDEIASFFFEHFPAEIEMRKNLLSACVRKNDINRALELVDMMASTCENEGYEELNGWSSRNRLTLHYLIDMFSYESKDKWDTKKDITDEMRENVKHLVYRMMPYLSEHDQEELKEKEIYKIDPESFDEDEYISRLLEDATTYSTFPKPRGKGGVANINRMSDEFMHCFDRLSNLKRLDVIVEIMTKFAKARDVLKPVSYRSWMDFMARGVNEGDMIQIFQLNKELFEAWLEDDNVDERDILDIAWRVADGASRDDYNKFCQFVVSRKGTIEGLEDQYIDIYEDDLYEETDDDDFDDELDEFDLDDELYQEESSERSDLIDDNRIIGKNYSLISDDDDNKKEEDAESKQAFTKKYLDTLFGLCEKFELVDGWEKTTNNNLKDALRVDLLKLCMFLSASDGTVDDVEALFFQNYLGAGLSPDHIRGFIKSQKLDYENFSTRVPSVIQEMMRNKALIMEYDLDFDEVITTFIEAYILLGSQLIECDNVVDENEKKDFTSYINMLYEYAHIDKKCDLYDVVEAKEKNKADEYDVKSVSASNKSIRVSDDPEEDKAIVYSGHGGQVIRNVDIPNKLSIATVKHTGSRLFSFEYYDSDANRVGMITHGIGKYHGTIMFENNRYNSGAGFLEVKADGDWKLILMPVTKALNMNGSSFIKGEGDTVTPSFSTEGGAFVVRLKHKGDRIFIVQLYDEKGNSQGLFHTIGEYDGEKIVKLEKGVRYYLAVKTTGEWSIDFGAGDEPIHVQQFEK